MWRSTAIYPVSFSPVPRLQSCVAEAVSETGARHGQQRPVRDSARGPRRRPEGEFEGHKNALIKTVRCACPTTAVCGHVPMRCLSGTAATAAGVPGRAGGIRPECGLRNGECCPDFRFAFLLLHLLVGNCEHLLMMSLHTELEGSQSAQSFALSCSACDLTIWRFC